MERLEPEEEYQRIQKKYSLPELKELSRCFGISLSSTDTVLHDVLDQILEKILENARIIECTIFVNTSSPISDLYESKMLTEEGKLFELYKVMMSLCWEARKVEIEAKEEEMTDFISKTHKKWEKEIAPSLVNLFNAFNKGWKDAKLHNSESNMTYHG